MTISRCEPLELETLRYVGVSSVDPDGVGIEVQTSDRRIVLDAYRSRSGETRIGLVSDGPFEIALQDMNTMIDRCLKELNAWEAHLRAPEGPWNANGTKA